MPAKFPGALVTMFTVDATKLGCPTIYRFHDGVDEFGNDITWQGIQYSRWPVRASGFSMAGNAQLPRPKMVLANVKDSVGSIIRGYNFFRGAKVIRSRTYAKYLDAVNFIGGNPLADPHAQAKPDVFFIERVVAEGRLTIEFELVSKVDMQNVLLPGRQIVDTYCTAVYKSPQCGYTGPLQTCDKGLNTSNGCMAHFGKDAELYFGSFPGCSRRR